MSLFSHRRPPSHRSLLQSTARCCTSRCKWADQRKRRTALPYNACWTPARCSAPQTSIIWRLLSSSTLIFWRRYTSPTTTPPLSSLGSLLPPMRRQSPWSYPLASKSSFHISQRSLPMWSVLRYWNMRLLCIRANWTVPTALSIIQLYSPSAPPSADWWIDSGYDFDQSKYQREVVDKISWQ